MTAGQGFVRRVTVRLLLELAPLLRRPGQAAAEEPEDAASVGDRSPAASSTTATQDDRELSKALNLFRGKPVKLAQQYRRAVKSQPPRARAKPARSPRVTKSADPASEPVAESSVPTGTLVWRKRDLPDSDVQRPKKGNPTGALRLTEARFKDQTGNLIDKTTYFRNTLFGNFPWRRTRTKPFVEATTVSIRVILRGKDYGVHDMTIRDKQSGEAGQGNYTSSLHWGGLGKSVRELRLTGLTLELFSPPARSNAPFTLRIE